jgi:antitoxin VapB
MNAMTITLPTDLETERLAKKLAQETGKSLPAIVKEAIEARASAAGIAAPTGINLNHGELLARMTALTQCFAAFPVLDPRTADEILGYDDRGIPQ